MENRRSKFERRSGKDRRKRLSLSNFFYSGPEKRYSKDRRSPIERRHGWVKINKWSSVDSSDLKISKYLQ